MPTPVLISTATKNFYQPRNSIKLEQLTNLAPLWLISERVFLFSALTEEEESTESIKTLNQITVKSYSTMKLIRTSARKNWLKRETKSHRNENFISLFYFMLSSFFFRLIKHLFYDKRRARDTKSWCCVCIGLKVRTCSFYSSSKPR